MDIKNQNKKDKRNIVNHMDDECYRVKSQEKFMKLFLL